MTAVSATNVSCYFPFFLFVHPVTPKQQFSSPRSPGGKKEKREKRGTVWYDGSGGGKQLGQKAKEALDRSKVWRLFLRPVVHPVLGGLTER